VELEGSDGAERVGLEEIVTETLVEEEGEMEMDGERVRFGACVTVVDGVSVLLPVALKEPEGEEVKVTVGVALKV
jgi:hypothetical protein